MSSFAEVRWHLNVRWPTAAADDCRAWLHELASGLVK